VALSLKKAQGQPHLYLNFHLGYFHPFCFSGMKSPQWYREGCTRSTVLYDHQLSRINFLPDIDSFSTDVGDVREFLTQMGGNLLYRTNATRSDTIVHLTICLLHEDCKSILINLGVTKAEYSILVVS